MHTRIIFFFLLASRLSGAQTFSETTTRELAFERKSADNALIVANLFGDVIVEGYAGENIVVEATRVIEGKTQERLELGKTEIQSGVIDRADTLILYVKDGCHEIVRNGDRKHMSSVGHGWNYQSVTRSDCRPVYDYKVDFLIKVPRTIHLVVSTINDGDIDIQNVDGVVAARNINGSIRLRNMKRECDAHTINGDVNIEYAKNPDRECRFYTLNGDINAVFPSGLSASLSFESFNGSFYTNIAQIAMLPTQVQKSARGNGLKYKVNGNRFQVGNGGPMLDFETFNGNLYLKEK